MHPDQKYITALLENDVLLIDEIYEKFAGKIRGMVLNYRGNEADAEDLFHEGLIIIFRKAASGNFELTCPFEGFLSMICKKKWINELNKRRWKNVTFDDSFGYSLSDEAYQQAELCILYNERQQLLKEIMLELDKGCRELLELSWESDSMNVVAGKLDVSYGYARKKKSECTGKLIALIKASPGFKYLKW